MVPRKIIDFKNLKYIFCGIKKVIVVDDKVLNNSFNVDERNWPNALRDWHIREFRSA
jgi:hypothetical protein